MKKALQFLLVVFGLFLLIRFWKYGRFICLAGGILLAILTFRMFFSVQNRQEVIGEVHLPKFVHRPKHIFDKLRRHDEIEEEDEEEDQPLFIREYVVPDGLDQSGSEDFTAKNVLSTEYDSDFERFED